VYQRRLKVLTFAFCGGFLLIGARLAHLQLIDGSRYRGLAETQPIRERILPTSRGRILDARGVVLAVDEQTYTLHLCPARFADLPAQQKEEWLAKVALWLGRDVDQLTGALSRLERDLEHQADRPNLTETSRKRELKWLRRRFHPLLTQLSFPEVARLEVWRDQLPQHPRKRDIFTVRAGTTRRYPQGSVAAHIIGYQTRVNAKEAPRFRRRRRDLSVAAQVDPEGYRDAYLKCYLPEENLGRRGLEKALEWTLRGRRGLRREMVDASGRVRKVLFDYPPQPGADVQSTLDIVLQRLAESALGDARGAVVILDVNTGAVLAMASSPRFNLDDFGHEFQRILKDDKKRRADGVPLYQRPRPLLDRGMQVTYPPGSVFKVVTALAALRAGAIGTQTEFTCRGSILVAGRPKQCMGFHGTLDLREAIERSCNVYFYQVALATPRAELLRTARELGFGSRTGIDVPSEAPGTLPELLSDADVANFAIGQGSVRVTPLQVAVMMAAIANGGTVLEPYLVSSGRGPVVRRRLDLPAAALDTLKRGLRDVVHGRRGTARQYVHLAGLTIAGKTGTAEVERPPLNHAWFAGFAPFDSPRIAFAAVVEYTKGHGGDTAAPIVANILSHLRFDPPQTTGRPRAGKGREVPRGS